MHGILATAAHGELNRFYTDRAKGVLGETYLPKAVLVSGNAGKCGPPLTSLAPSMEAPPAEVAYVERIAVPGERYGFPDWYVKKIRSFQAHKV